MAEAAARDAAPGGFGGTLLLTLGQIERRRNRPKKNERRVIETLRFATLDDDALVKATVQATAWGRHWGTSLGLTADIVNDVEICIEEWVSNILMHGAKQGIVTKIRLDAQRHDSGVSFRVDDDGPAFDPTAHPAVGQKPTTLETMTIGGLGIDFIRQRTAGLAYRRQEGMNCLTFDFRIPAVESALQTALANSALLAKFPYDALWQLAASAEPVRFEAGAKLLRQGEDGGSALALLEGEVDISLRVGVLELVIARVGPGNVIGEMAAFSTQQRTASALAVTPVKALRIDHAVLYRLINAYPEACAAVISELSARINRLNFPLAVLTHAAQSLEQGACDDTLMDLLMSADFDLPVFASVMRGLTNQIRTEQQRRADLATAARIQQSILPSRPPARADGRVLSLATLMTPAKAIGGDFFDHFLIGDRILAVAVADVSGKGIPAALFMSMACTVLRSVATASEGRGAAPIIAQANRLICASNAESMFLTLFFALIDLETGATDYVNAGHNPSYLLRADGVLDQVVRTGPLVGLYETAVWRSEQVTLAPGDLLVAYTDGVTEALDPDQQLFGEDRFEAALREAHREDPEQVIRHVTSVVANFVGPCDASDDLTLLVYRA